MVCELEFLSHGGKSCCFVRWLTISQHTGFFPKAPRPRLPFCLPSINASSSSKCSVSQYKLSLCPMVSRNFYNSKRAVGQETPINLVNLNAEMPPLSDDTQ